MKQTCKDPPVLTGLSFCELQAVHVHISLRCTLETSVKESCKKAFQVARQRSRRRTNNSLCCIFFFPIRSPIRINCKQTGSYQQSLTVLVCIHSLVATDSHWSHGGHKESCMIGIKQNTKELPLSWSRGHHSIHQNRV